MTSGPPGTGPVLPAQRPADADRTGRRVVALFRPYRGRVAVIGVTILLSSLLGLALPFLTQAIFDRALFPRLGDGVVGEPRLGLLVALVAVSIVVTLVGAAIGVGQTWLTTRLGNAVMRDLRGRLFAHLQRMELSFFTSTRTACSPRATSCRTSAGTPAAPSPRGPDRALASGHSDRTTWLRPAALARYMQ